MITEAINNVVEGNDLSTGDAESAMTQIMEGKATDAQIGSFLTALRLKGETIDEISAFASIMRDKASAIKPKVEPLLDTCGT
ncbi:MAG TPA: anthranilate phosphoribosyltransferase, partial [Actinobacteria bacterium]|nr:anthranilate phosphoribosyltransferase [Actinomycetota bacterium]